MKDRKKNQVEEIALTRIERLFSLANAEYSKNPANSHRWIRLALSIATRNRVRIPLHLKQSYCKKCHSFLKEGKNKTTTNKNGFDTITCKECKAVFKRKTGETK